MIDVVLQPERSPEPEATLVVFVGEGRGLTAGARAADVAMQGQLGRAMQAADFTGKKGAIVEVLAPAGLSVPRLLVVGLGDADKADARVFEALGGKVAARLLRHARTVQADFTDLSGVAIDRAAAAVHFAHGLELRSWQIDTYHTRRPEAERPQLARLVLAGVGEGARPQLQRLQQLAAGVAMARELVSEPANILYPQSFVERVRGPAEALGIGVRVLDEAELQALGAGALLGVAQGSVRPPRLLALEWNGTGTSGAPQLALVGKGVTFDTGGISLKPGPGMGDMKFDMGGAAAVVGAMLALAGRKANAHVVGVCGLVENMPDGNAQRPGDIVTGMSGQTIEVLNTDAEGRLVLSDCLTWVQRTYHPKLVLDFATLTGAIIVSLAHLYAGVFTPSDALWAKLDAAGRAVDDLVWRQPLSEPGGYYDKMLKSPIADMKNVGPREGGSVTAAQFLQRFIEPGVEWAHLDIAGTVWRTEAGDLHDKGATGYGVRLVDRFVADHLEA